MKNKLNIFTSMMILSSSLAYGDSSSINEAFKNANISGDLSAHTQQVDDGTSKSGFSSATFGLNFETDSSNGVSAQAGFRANHELSTKNAGDYNAEFANNAVMTLANIKYSNDTATIIAGKQEIDLEWIGDYNDAVLASITPIDNLEITAAFARRQAAVGVDESGDFQKIGNDGVYLLDAKYEAVKGLIFNPYYYDAKDVASYYGLKTDFDTDNFGITAHYAASNEDNNTMKDASIINLEARTSITNIDLSLGYIKTNEDISSITTAGDNIDPTEEIGGSVYAKDSKTIYAGIAYTIADIELSAAYAQAKYANNKDKELALSAGYTFIENLSAELLYVNYEVANVDQSKIAATLTYEF